MLGLLGDASVNEEVGEILEQLVHIHFNIIIYLFAERVQGREGLLEGLKKQVKQMMITESFDGDSSFKTEMRQGRTLSCI